MEGKISDLELYKVTHELAPFRANGSMHLKPFYGGWQRTLYIASPIMYIIVIFWSSSLSFAAKMGIDGLRREGERCIVSCNRYVQCMETNTITRTERERKLGN